MLLKQSTAATIKLGPFVDDADGKTAETGLTISQADIRLSKNGGDIAQSHNAAGATHDELGYYDVPLDTTDTDTLGRLRVAVSESGALPVWQDFMVVPANVFDSLVSGSDLLDANASQLGGTSQTGRDVGASVLLSSGTGAGQLDFTSGVVKANLAQILGTALTETAGQIAAAFKKFFNVASPTGTVNSLPDAVPGANGGLPTTNGTKVNQTVDLTAGQTIPTVTNLTNLPSIPADWLTASGVKADAVTKIQNGLALEATLTAIKGAGWVNESLVSITTDIDSVKTNQTVVEGKVDVIDGIVDDILEDTSTTLPAAIAASSGGSGSTPKTYTVTDGTNPIAGVYVWVTTDIAGTNIIASGVTDDVGEVIFFLDSGTTYYLWRKKTGYAFTNPDVQTA